MFYVCYKLDMVDIMKINVYIQCPGAEQMLLNYTALLKNIKGSTLFV